MKSKITIKKLIDNSNIPASLIRAVVKQSGGWESFTEMAPDVADHGASGGFNGWIYYTETLAFTRHNRKAIMEYAAEQAKEFGQGTLEMIQGFGVFRNDKPSIDEIAQAIYRERGNYAAEVLNVLAWYALEETARLFTDLADQ